MTDPLPQPVRVLIKGASTVVWTSWMGGPRTDYGFPRALESELLAAGVPAEVRNTAVPAERIKVALKQWDRDVLPFSPDVVMLNYGQMESIHKLLPHAFERHAHSLHRRTGRSRDLYRRHVIRPVYKVAAQGQAALDRRLPPLGPPFNPTRLANDLGHLVERIRSVQSPLVLIPDIVAPSKTYREWFPGYSDRVDAMNAALRALVARVDHPDVRMFEMREVVAAQVGDGDPSPDGAHFTPEVHFAIGRALAEVVIAWRATQPHLLDWDAHPMRSAGD